MASLSAESMSNGLREMIDEVGRCYIRAVQCRLHDEGIGLACCRAVDSGIAQFSEVYGSAWALITHQEGLKGLEEYNTAVASLQAQVDAAQTARNRIHPFDLYADALGTKPLFDGLLQDIVGELRDWVYDPCDLDLKLAPLKKVSRVIEKAALRPVLDSSMSRAISARQVYDVVRAMASAPSMHAVTMMVNKIVDAATDGRIVIDRVKDRWATPTAGGWRDLMINFHLGADQNQHVCELQIVHHQLLMARAGLPGHAIYGRMRNAAELWENLLESADCPTPWGAPGNKARWLRQVRNI